jgi:hypothetical protein
MPPEEVDRIPYVELIALLEPIVSDPPPVSRHAVVRIKVDGIMRWLPE